MAIELMSVEELQLKLQKFLQSTREHCSTAGVTADHVLILSLLVPLTVGSCIALYPETRWPLLLIPVTLLLRAVLNMLVDLMLQDVDATPPGTILLRDLCNLASEAAVLLPLALLSGISSILVGGAAVQSYLVEFTGLAALQFHVPRRTDGPMNTQHRGYTVAALAFALGCGIPAWVWPDLVLAAFNGLLLLTILNRWRQTFRAIEQQAGQEQGAERSENTPQPANSDTASSDAEPA
jgi:CDP-diacylglycerol--glycerol-3-phosphate 3-phosphatidyltransferase